MSIKFQLFGGAKAKRKLMPHYGLTPLGKIKAEEFHISGPKGEVMAALESNGESTISEIAESARMTPERVKQVLQSLVANGYVRKVATED